VVRVQPESEDGLRDRDEVGARRRRRAGGQDQEKQDGLQLLHDGRDEKGVSYADNENTVT
jgi:hypothetical protein